MSKLTAATLCRRERLKASGPWVPREPRCRRLLMLNAALLKEVRRHP